MSKTTGRCLCGALQYEYHGEPEEVIHCHCETCRRHSSSPVATFVMVKASALRFTQGRPKEFASSPGVRRSFCGGCGSPIAYQSERRLEIVAVAIVVGGTVTGILPGLCRRPDGVHPPDVTKPTRLKA
jgi:hypothetical protein